MSEIDRLEKLASVYKEAAWPAAVGAGVVAALKWLATHKLTALMTAWIASGVVEHATARNPAMAKTKEALTELIELVKKADASKMSQQDLTIIKKFLTSAQAILPQIEKVNKVMAPSPEGIDDLGKFLTDARFVAYNAHSVANIMDKIESWYASVGGFLVGMFGFGMEITDVRKAKARAVEVAATLGALVSGLEVALENTAKDAQQRIAQQPAAGDEISEFARLRPA